MPKGNWGGRGNPEAVKPFQYKKGQSGNPKGASPDPPEFKMLKNLSKTEMVEIANVVLRKDITELQAIAQNPQTKILHAMIAAVAVRIISKGDMTALNVLLDRLIGKVRDEVHHSGEVLNAPKVIITLPSNSRENQIIDVTPKPALKEADDKVDGFDLTDLI